MAPRGSIGQVHQKDEKMSLKLFGNIPSKKNSRRLFARGNKLINIPSEKYVEWHDVAVKQIEEQNIPPIKGRVEISAKIWYANNRRKDNDNTFQSILDLLQDCGIIEDDSWQIVPKCEIEAMGIDKNNPRAEITIKCLDS